MRVGEDYYMVNSTFRYFPAIAISHSKDMVHGHVIGHAITDPDELDLQDIRDSRGIWAPDISYCNDKFIIMATLRLNADGKRDNNVMRRQLVVILEKPEGPYSKPSWLEADSIDPSHFIMQYSQRAELVMGMVLMLDALNICLNLISHRLTIH